MPELEELTADELAEERPDLIEEITAKVEAEIADSVEESATDEDDTEEADEEMAAESAVTDEVAELRAENERMRAKGAIEDELRETDLGEAARSDIRDRLAGARCAEGDEDEIREAVQAAAERVADILQEAGVGKPRGVTGSADSGDEINVRDAIAEAAGFQTDTE